MVAYNEGKRLSRDVLKGKEVIDRDELVQKDDEMLNNTWV